MKISFTSLLIIFLFASVGVNAQKWRLNLSGGIDAASGTVAGTSGGIVASRIGVGGGLDLEMNCSPVVSVQLGVNYSEQGYGFAKENADAATAELSYVTIPVLLRLKATKDVYFLAGPQVGILLSAKSNISGSPAEDSKSALESIYYYAVIGAGFRFPNNIFVDARYHYGFNNVIKDSPENEVTNRYFSFRLGYSFPLGKK
jgi:hypothetical protein